MISVVSRWRGYPWWTSRPPWAKKEEELSRYKGIREPSWVWKQVSKWASECANEWAQQNEWTMQAVRSKETHERTRDHLFIGFLDAFSLLYKRLCPAIRPSIRNCYLRRGDKEMTTYQIMWFSIFQLRRRYERRYKCGSNMEEKTVSRMRSNCSLRSGLKGSE